MIEVWPCWINSIRMKQCGLDPILDNQIVRTSKIGLSQPHSSLCICVVVDSVIIIKCQSHKYQNLVLLSTIAGIIGQVYVQMPRHSKTSCMLAVETIKALADNVSFVKGRGCNDKEFGVPPPIYNCEHVHMCIAVLTKKVIYANIINHAHRQCHLCI